MRRAGARSSHLRRSSHPAQRYGPVDGRNQVLGKPHLQTLRSQCQQRLNLRARGSAHAALDSRTVVSFVVLGGFPADCRFLLHREFQRSPRPRTPRLYLDVFFVSQSSLLRARAQSRQAHECACGFNEWVERWSPPSRPAGLDGSERAQRHRALCNRRHNFLRC
jgi:hypothetical protein